MSADNFVGVRPQKVNGQLTGNYEIFEYGNMSVYGEDCMYLTNVSPDHHVNHGEYSRALALVQAHDIVNAMDICEYGVVEMPPIPDEPCGRCFVCVHERNIAHNDLTRCDGCGEPIAEGEWQVLTSGRNFHSRCARERV